MNKNHLSLALTLLVACLLSLNLSAQKPIDAAILVSAKVSKTLKQIELKWDAKTGVNNIWIFKKKPTDISFGGVYKTLSATDTNFIDTAITIGYLYEYHIRASFNTHTAYGYISTGIEVPATVNRGGVILLVDDTCALNLPNEVKRLENDLRADGWVVIRKDVKRTDSVKNIKAIIVSEYLKRPTLIKSVFLLGHIPVPYSGTFAPDAHPDHRGAWPADMFYGDIDGIWTDNITNELGSRAANKNYPNDGKYDQDEIPSSIELEVGRVDLSDMPIFNKTETALMKQYLDRDHNHRSGTIRLKERGIIDDNFGWMSGEAFAASGYKAMSPTVGGKNIITGDYLTNLKKQEYQWSYGCGGGTYRSASGIGNTDSFAKPNDTLKTVFTMLFGSYFGDWDNQNNFLRAPLAAQGYCLTNAWSGRPHWVFHHMAMGKTIGHSAKISFQDITDYFRHPSSIYGRTRQIALMGDPTIMQHHIMPPKNLTKKVTEDTAKNETTVTLTWSKSPEIGAQYRVYKFRAHSDSMQEITSTPISDTTIDIPMLPNGKWHLMVRAEKLHTSASGSYYLLSKGIWDSVQLQYSVGIKEQPLANAPSLSLYPNPVQDIVFLNLQNPDAKQIKQITIQHISGKILWQGIPSQYGYINTATLPNGFYLLTTTLSNNTSLTNKFIKR